MRSGTPFIQWNGQGLLLRLGGLVVWVIISFLPWYASAHKSGICTAVSQTLRNRLSLGIATYHGCRSDAEGTLDLRCAELATGGTEHNPSAS